MKAGDRITHIYNTKKIGVIVRQRSNELEILWNGENLPRRHPLDMILPIEVAVTVAPVSDVESADESEEVEDSAGVEELSLEIVTEIEPEIEAEEEQIDPADIVESEIIGDSEGV